MDCSPGRRPERGCAAKGAGYVRSLGAVPVGNAALRLGAGRHTKDDQIDHAVGIVTRTKRGDKVSAGDTLAEIHAPDESSAEGAESELLEAYEIAGDEPEVRSVILDVITS